MVPALSVEQGEHALLASPGEQEDRGDLIVYIGLAHDVLLTSCSTSVSIVTATLELP